MSYTMTLDVPKNVSTYVDSRGPRFRDELKFLFVSFIQAKMKYEGVEDVASTTCDEVPGKKLLASFREGDRIAAGKNPTKWYKSADKLIADCLT